jgi:hypothetical protein
MALTSRDCRVLQPSPGIAERASPAPDESPRAGSRESAQPGLHMHECSEQMTQRPRSQALHRVSAGSMRAARLAIQRLRRPGLGHGPGHGWQSKRPSSIRKSRPSHGVPGVSSSRGRSGSHSRSRRDAASDVGERVDHVLAGALLRVQIGESPAPPTSCHRPSFEQGNFGQKPSTSAGSCSLTNPRSR